MTRIFLDTNIFLRFLIPEDKTTFQHCQLIFEKAKSGSFIPFISDIVLQEIIYVLKTTYKFPREKIINTIKKISQIRNIVIVEKTDISQALDIYYKYNIKFGDCLIATQIPKGATLCSYDKDFSTLPFLSVAPPSKIIE